MDMADYNCEVVKFLAQPANIEYVFDIGERLEQVKNYLHLKFWHMVQKILDARITDPGRERNWDVDKKYKRHFRPALPVARNAAHRGNTRPSHATQDGGRCSRRGFRVRAPRNGW
jgi:hypothetical protein